MKNKISLIGSAFGHGAQNVDTCLAPRYLQEVFRIVDKLNDSFIKSYWYQILEVQKSFSQFQANPGKNFNNVLENISQLRVTIKSFLLENNSDFPVIIGGDHSCAIATWSSIIEALDLRKKYGLIWIDAHMDAHTVHTSPSGAYHGMPISFLLGHNVEHFNLSKKPLIDPNNIVIIGVRSFEKEERDFLETKQVRVYYIDEVNKRGLKDIFVEALKIVKKNTKYFGVSIDIDALDPLDAPGVGSPVEKGIRWQELKTSLPILFSEQCFNALEIAEFNPSFDIDNRTAKILLQIIIEAAEHRVFENVIKSRF